MLRNPASSRISALRRAVILGGFALAAALAATPAAAFVHMHGGGVHGGSFHPHMAFGGFHHDFDHHFRHDFDHRFHHRRFFGFAGFDFEPGYAYDYEAYDPCLRHVWGPYGWRWVNVCY